MSKNLLKHLLIISAFLISNKLCSQNVGDTKIIVSVDDTTGLYEKIKIALVKNDFIVKEDGNKDTLQTYSREFTSLQGFLKATAEIKGNTITIYGFYGLKKVNE